MIARCRLFCLTAIPALALMANSGCEAPQPGASKPLFGPQPQPGAKPATPLAGDGKPAPLTEIDVTTVPMRDDITAVYQFYSQEPWLRNTDGAVIGFSSSVYFHSGETERGAFVPGKALTWVYEMVPQPRGKWERKLVNVWELDEQEAMGFRVRRHSKMGYAYGFFFRWPPGVDLSGKIIEIMFGYERLDGRVVTGAARRFEVPQSRFALETSSPPATLPRATPAHPTERPDSQPPAAGGAPAREPAP